MAIGPSSASSARRMDTKMAVGPSAPPMMPMAPAFSNVNPSAMAPRRVPKMPICAAAPSNAMAGAGSRE